MKKKYTKKQITEAIAYWEKRLAESEEHQMADGADINKALSDDKFKKEAADYAAKNSWLAALALAQSIAAKCRELAATLSKQKPSDDLNEAEKSMFSAAEDIKHGMFALAKAGHLPKDGYKG